MDRHTAQALGVRAERFVAQALHADGWRILNRNWLGAGAELDLVVGKGGRVRFVEVKARSSSLADGLDALTPSKRRRLGRAARAWMHQCRVPIREVAFAVAVVDLTSRPWMIHWFDDPFDGE